MWFTREQFEICNELKQWGLSPRCEPGDVVVRGFADLGYEEFQVLPSSKLLSLTAGTITNFPPEHTQHLFWVPSVDEATELLERKGVVCVSCSREDQREWAVEAQYDSTLEVHRAESLHTALLLALCAVYKRAFKDSE
jgi:hypothetical protein